MLLRAAQYGKEIKIDTIKSTLHYCILVLFWHAFELLSKSFTLCDFNFALGHIVILTLLNCAALTLLRH